MCVHMAESNESYHGRPPLLTLTRRVDGRAGSLGLRPVGWSRATKAFTEGIRGGVIGVSRRHTPEVPRERPLTTFLMTAMRPLKGPKRVGYGPSLRGDERRLDDQHRPF